MAFQLLADAIENRELAAVLPVHSQYVPSYPCQTDPSKRLREEARFPGLFNADSEFCWTFGWPVSMTDVDELVETYSSLPLTRRATGAARIGSILSPMRILNYYSAIRIVVVQPEGDINWP